MANQVSTAKNIYFNTHLLSVLEVQMKKQLNYLEQVVEMLVKREENGELPYETLELAKSKLNQKRIDLLFLSQSKREILINLAEAINLKGPWDLLQIQTLTLENPKYIDFNINEYQRKISSISYQKTALEYLKEGAKYAAKSRVWSFLTPDGGGSAFGFGLIGEVRLGRAEVESVKLELESYQNNLNKTLFVLNDQFKNIYQVYDEAINGENHTFNVLGALQEDLLTNGQIDINDFYDNIEMLFSFQYTSLLTIHAFMEAKSKLERMLRSSKEYQNLEKLIPEKKDHKFRFLTPEWREERAIDKAIKKGLIKLPLT